MVATHIARKVAAVVKLSLTLSSLLFGTLQTQVVPKLVSRGWMQRRQHRFSYPDCGREIWWPINNQVSLELRAPSNPPKRKGGSGECSTTFLDLRAILVAVANIITISWLPHPTNCSLYYLLSTPLIYWSLVSNFKGLAFSRIHSTDSGEDVLYRPFLFGVESGVKTTVQWNLASYPGSRWAGKEPGYEAKWNLSITDTIGNQHFVPHSEVSLTQGLPVYFQ